MLAIPIHISHGNASQALDRGLIARIDANWFALSPALTCTDAELAELCALVEASLVAAIAVARAAA